MKINKILIIATLMLVLLGIFVYGLFTGKKRTQTQETVSKIPVVNIPRQYKSKLNITLNVDKEKIEIPSTLPLLKLTFKTIDEKMARSYAQNLEFEKEVIITKDIKEGTKYIWSDDSQYLFVTPSTYTIKYGLSIPEPPKTKYIDFTDEQIMNIAKKFIVEKFNISEEQVEAKSISFNQISPRSEGLKRTNKDNASLYQVNLSYTNSGYEILTLNPNKPLAFVNILPDGRIFSSELILVNSVEKTPENYPILNYDEISANLNRAVIINIMNDYTTLGNISDGSIKSIEVQNIKIAYLYDQIKADTLQPVILLEGKAEITGVAADFAQLYLLAIKNP